MRGCRDGSEVKSKCFAALPGNTGLIPSTPEGIHNCSVASSVCGGRYACGAEVYTSNKTKQTKMVHIKLQQQQNLKNKR